MHFIRVLLRIIYTFQNASLFRDVVELLFLWTFKQLLACTHRYFKLNAVLIHVILT
jgi:hypothetical protein